MNRTHHDRLILTTQNRVLSLEAHYCNLKSDSTNCDQLRYPYCKWSLSSNRCIHLNDLDDLATISNKTSENVTSLVHIDLTANHTNLTAKSMQIIQQIENDAPSDYLVDLTSSKITISMNLIVFMFALSAFLILSFLIGVLASYFIYSNTSKLKLAHLFNKFTFAKSTHLNTNKNGLIVKISSVDSANNILVNDMKKTEIDCSQLYSTVKSKTKRESNNLGVVSSSVCSSSASSLSPIDESITKSTILSCDNDPRYVYVNSKQANLSILGLIDQTYESARIDENDYFSLRRAASKPYNSSNTPSVNVTQTAANDLSTASSSSSSPNSAQTSTSTTKLVKSSANNYEINTHNYLNRTLPTISVQMRSQSQQQTIDRNTFNKKYYI